MYTTWCSETPFSLTHFPLRRKFIFIYLDLLFFLVHSRNAVCMLMEVGRARGTSGNTIHFKSGTIQSPACRALRQHMQAPRRRSTQLPSDDSCQLTPCPMLTGSLDVTVQLPQGEEHHSRGGSSGWEEARSKISDNFPCSLLSALWCLSMWDKT